MADETKTQADAAAEAPAKVAAAIAETSTKLAAEGAKVAKRERAAGTRRAKRQEKAVKAVRTAKRKSAARKAKRSAARPAAVNERINDMTFDFNNLFAGVPAAQPFQTLFAEAGERGQEAVKKSQKVAGELADLTRANVEAIVDAGRIAVDGARALGQDMVATNREALEQAAEAVRSFAEAKSPTEFLQLQGDFARSSFDRMVAEGSKLTESFVKLAGEAIQPLSNRASVNAERINQLVA